MPYVGLFIVSIQIISLEQYDAQRRLLMVSILSESEEQYHARLRFVCSEYSE